MTGKTEWATLSLKDETSPVLKKIANEINALGEKFKKLGSNKVDLKVNSKGLDKFRNDIDKLLSSEKKLGRNKIKLAIDIKPLDRAIASIERLNRIMRSLPKVTIDADTKRLQQLAGGGGGGGNGGRGNNSSGGVGSPSETPFLVRSAKFILQSALTLNVTGAVINAVKEGSKISDEANSSLTLLGLGKDKVDKINKKSGELSSETRVGSPARFKGLMGELVRITGGDVNQAFIIADAIKPMMRAMTQMGMSSEDIFRDINKMVKAGESSQRLSKPGESIIDPIKAKEYFDTITKAMIQSGGDLTPADIYTALTNANAAKYGLDSRGLLTLFATFEENRTRASTGLNQLQKQIGGRGVKDEVLANQAEWGLIKTRLVDSGTIEDGAGGKEKKKNGKAKKTKKLVSDGGVDEELRNSDPNAWVQKYIVSGMKAHGLDPNNINDIIKTSYLLTGSATAVNELISLIASGNSIQKYIDNASKLDVTDKGLSAGQDTAGVSELKSLNEQFIGAAGAIGETLADVIAPATRRLGASLSYFSSLVSGSGDGGTGSVPIAVGGAVAGGVGLYGVYKGLGKAIDGLTGIGKLKDAAQAIGGVGLDTSAALLNTAGIELNKAAAALLRLAGVESVPSSGPGTAPNSGGIPTPGKPKKSLGRRFIKGLGWVSLAAAATYGAGELLDNTGDQTVGPDGKKLTSKWQKADALADAFGVNAIVGAADELVSNIKDNANSWSQALAGVNLYGDKARTAGEQLSADLAVLSAIWEGTKKQASDYGKLLNEKAPQNQYGDLKRAEELPKTIFNWLKSQFDGPTLADAISEERKKAKKPNDALKGLLAQDPQLAGRNELAIDNKAVNDPVFGPSLADAKMILAAAQQEREAQLATISRLDGSAANINGAANAIDGAGGSLAGVISSALIGAGNNVASAIAAAINGAMPQMPAMAVLGAPHPPSRAAKATSSAGVGTLAFGGTR